MMIKKRTKQVVSFLGEEDESGTRNTQRVERRSHRRNMHLDRSMGTDELNLAEFPLISLAGRLPPGQNTLAFRDRVFDESTQKPVNRSLIITGSEHFGLPGPADGDVLLTLVHLTNVRNGFKEKRVEFSRYELVNFLGWDPGGGSYRRLQESLQRWTSVTLHYKQAWWDRTGRNWKNVSFHVLDSLALRGRSSKIEEHPSVFTWSDTIFNSFQSGNLKKIDLNLYFQLERPVSRQLYRFLDKRFYWSRRLEFSLRELACEHVGLSRCYDTYDLRRKLQPAIEELESIGFLQSLSLNQRYEKVAPGEWKIVFYKGPSQLTGKGRPVHPLVDQLKSRGITAGVASRLVREFPAHHVEEKIALHDSLRNSQDRRISRNPAGFLTSAIRNDYQVSLPLQATPHTEKSSPEKAVARMSKAEDRVKLAALRRLEEAWKHFLSLSPEEQDQTENQAIASGSRLQVETYLRHKHMGSPLAHELRNGLIADYLDSRPPEERCHAPRHSETDTTDSAL